MTVGEAALPSPSHEAPATRDGSLARASNAPIRSTGVCRQTRSEGNGARMFQREIAEAKTASRTTSRVLFTLLIFHEMAQVELRIYTAASARGAAVCLAFL